MQGKYDSHILKYLLWVEDYCWSLVWISLISLETERAEADFLCAAFRSFEGSLLWPSFASPRRGLQGLNQDSSVLHVMKAMVLKLLLQLTSMTKRKKKERLALSTLRNFWFSDLDEILLRFVKTLAEAISAVSQYILRMCGGGLSFGRPEKGKHKTN